MCLQDCTTITEAVEVVVVLVVLLLSEVGDGNDVRPSILVGRFTRSNFVVVIVVDPVAFIFDVVIVRGSGDDSLTEGGIRICGDVTTVAFPSSSVLTPKLRSVHGNAPILFLIIFNFTKLTFGFFLHNNNNRYTINNIFFLLQSLPPSFTDSPFLYIPCIKHL